MKRFFLINSFLIFNLIFADNENCQLQINNQLKDHFIVLYNNIQDRDNLLIQLNELALRANFAIFKEALIKTNNSNVYGAKIPFYPAMREADFYTLLHENIEHHLIDNVISKELKSGPCYCKIEISLTSLVNLIKFLTNLMVAQNINVQLINFPSGSCNLINSAFHTTITFNPLKVAILMNILNNINPEIKRNIINLKVISGQFL